MHTDTGNLRAALDGVPPTEAFMTAASPGVIAHFLRNEHYPSREAYLARPSRAPIPATSTSGSCSGR